MNFKLDSTFFRRQHGGSQDSFVLTAPQLFARSLCYIPEINPKDLPAYSEQGVSILLLKKKKKNRRIFQGND